MNKTCMLNIWSEINDEIRRRLVRQQYLLQTPSIHRHYVALGLHLSVPVYFCTLYTNNYLKNKHNNYNK